MVDDSHGFLPGWGNGPTTAQKINLLVGIDSAGGLDGQMEVQERGWRAGAGRCAVFGHGSIPRLIGTETRSAANGGVLAHDLTIQQFLGGWVILDPFVSQERDQAFLQSPKTAFDFAFGLGAGRDQMRDAQSEEGTLKF